MLYEEYKKTAEEQYLKNIKNNSNVLETKNTYVKNAGLNKFNKNKGLGVFAKNKIFEKNIIEYCPAVVLDLRHKLVRDRSLYQYCYWHFDKESEECKKYGPVGLISLGSGAIMNSADEKGQVNCSWITFPESRLVLFYATKDIELDEEILCWWGSGYYNSWCK
jgi:SET domain-containing protein